MHFMNNKGKCILTLEILPLEEFGSHAKLFAAKARGKAYL